VADAAAARRRTPQRLVLPIDNFCFSNVRGLTRVGGIYIEVYNSDPRWQVEDPPSLLGKLFDAIAHGVDGRPASMRQRCEALQVCSWSSFHFNTQLLLFLEILNCLPVRPVGGPCFECTPDGGRYRTRRRCTWPTPSIRPFPSRAC